MSYELKYIMLGFIIGCLFMYIIKRKSINEDDYTYREQYDKSILKNNLDNQASLFSQEGVSEEVKNDVISLCNDGKKVEAIKTLRDCTGWKLRECKEFVEKL